MSDTQAGLKRTINGTPIPAAFAHTGEDLSDLAKLQMGRSDIRDHITPDWLKDVPFHQWVSKGYIHQDEYWPFGRSASRYEGSTQVVGPFSEALWTAAKRFQHVGLKVLVRSAVGGRPSVQRKDFKTSHSQRYRDGLDQGTIDKRFPISAVVIITVSTAHSDTPGLLWCDLDGCSDQPALNRRC
ncbi:hypothetical protein LTR74_016721 [Friedmanniomyces endolithicus]|nr:hypothetical protein LTR74_016721 [Friedmanniomyces endolithicus]